SGARTDRRSALISALLPHKGATPLRWTTRAGGVALPVRRGGTHRCLAVVASEGAPAKGRIDAHPRSCDADPRSHRGAGRARSDPLAPRSAERRVGNEGGA